MKQFKIHNITNEAIHLPILKKTGITLSIKREDKIHAFISGNKYRKLKYNLQEASKQKHTALLSFGGAYSNHIAAVAQAGELFGFKTIGIIRGEELADKVSENTTLTFARSKGMKLVFVSREQYRKKNEQTFLESLNLPVDRFYTIPEGGTNELAVKGCEEILNEQDKQFNYIACCVGTGGTIAGLTNATTAKQQVIGFPALRGDFLTNDIRKFVHRNNWTLIHDYSFGGYAKVNRPLIEFLNEFYHLTGIQLDPVYTGKMMFGILDLIKNSYFKKGTNILAIHTGGIQGIAGMNQKLKRKKLPLISL